MEEFRVKKVWDVLTVKFYFFAQVCISDTGVSVAADIDCQRNNFSLKASFRNVP